MPPAEPAGAPAEKSAPAPDLAAVKARQQTTWASGDFSAVATVMALVSERVADAADLRAGWRVLDVATGSGNAALAAARLGCDVTGCDYVPTLLERGRERARAERLPVTLVEGDAEALPFGDGEFDAVLSVLGTMFAPDHRRTAAEVARVCRAGGRIGLVSWTPTALAGLAEWSSADLVTRRLGVVHAACNVAAGLVYAGSWAARVRERDRLGVALARLGGVALLASGFLGGHMGSSRRSTDADRQAVGTSAARIAPRTPLT